MRNLLLTIALVSAGCAPSAPVSTDSDSAPTRERPNILFMLVDDMRWDEFGAAGHPFVETPNIDRLAREGSLFVNAFTTTPLCSPARASFLTGQYAHANGIIDNTERGPTSHAMRTFPRDLHDAGYETAFVGKWHMGRDDSKRPGFDYWVTMQGQGSLVDPEIIENDEREVIEGHVTEIFTERAVRFLERERDQPFLLYVAYKALHPGRGGLVAGGFTAPDRFENRYADVEIPRRENYGVAPTDKPALQRPFEGLPELGPESVTPDQTIRDRAEMLLGVDDSVGRLLQTLEEQGELDNTVVVFTSDHGYFYGEHGMNAERRLAYEETARIPLLVRYPAVVKAGSKPEPLVLAIDLAPTLLELGGVTPHDGIQGRSLVPIFSDAATEWRTSILIEHHSDPFSYIGRSPLRRATNMGYHAVRTEQHKYIRYTDLENMDELYDLENDPYELTNLIDEPEAANTLEALQGELAMLLEQTGMTE